MDDMRLTCIDVAGAGFPRSLEAASSAATHAAPPWSEPRPLQCVFATSSSTAPSRSRKSKTSASVASATCECVGCGQNRRYAASVGSVRCLTGVCRKRSQRLSIDRYFVWCPRNSSASVSPHLTSQARKPSVLPTLSSRVSMAKGAPASTNGASGATSPPKLTDSPARPPSPNSAWPQNVETWSRMARSAPSGGLPSSREHQLGSRAVATLLRFSSSTISTGPPQAFKFWSRYFGPKEPHGERRLWSQ
mmetsp:Transcript_3399/g.10308  ORF Transcript_3399/g.10308 Transcript_3399/m.10308 type:complete len:248 (-) Transcript_3399:59-802(-)